MAFGKRYRFFYVPPGTSEVKQVEVPTRLLVIGVFLTALLLVGTVFTTWIAVQSSTREAGYKAEIDRLQEENQAQQFHVQKFVGQVGDLNRKMERLQNFHAKLKILANLDLQEHPETSTATGGPQPNDPDLNVYLEKNLKQQIQRIHWELEELQMQARIQEQNAHRVENFFDSQRSLLAATPTIWPVHGWVTSAFGHRISPFTGTLQMHEGIDIGARSGTPVKAPADGVVIYSGWKSEFGKMISLDHGYGYRTRYGHLSKIYVKNGQRVKRGALIGSVGSTGKSTGPHLHYEVKLNNVPVNPKKYLLN